ncbi:MAG: LysM peptidoglycan-binding domain-containing protein [Caldilineaceae bacterium]
MPPETPAAESRSTPRTAARAFVRLLSAALPVLALLFLLLRVGHAQEGEATPEPTVTPTPSVQPTPTTTNFFLLTQPYSPTNVTGTAGLNVTTVPPQIHVVEPGDTLMRIAGEYNVSLELMIELNRLDDPNRLEVGQSIVIPTGPGEAPPAPAVPPGLVPVTSTINLSVTDIVSRLTPAGRAAPVTSPYYRTTWLTYYGRPNVFVMGILGEHDIPTLTGLLKEKAGVIDAANGARLRVKPAFHLVHGMATVQPTPEDDHLEYLPDETVMAYINAGLKENIAVILDVQVGALSLTEAISPVLKYLKYPNVHLAVDPEFAMSHAGQSVPGDPIGYVSGAEINDLQEYVATWMEENNIRGRRILMVHQFFEEMIINKDQIAWDNPRLELTFVADGWGDPGGKIWKYNNFFSGREDAKYSAFKLFYRWDEPLITERQALGVDKYNDRTFIDVTPNMIIYQ